MRSKAQARSASRMTSIEDGKRPGSRSRCATGCGVELCSGPLVIALPAKQRVLE